MTYRLSPILTNKQRNIILGEVLGGGSIVKPKKGQNCYLSMRGNNYNWLMYKKSELYDLCSENALFEESNKKYFRIHSICYPLFNEFYEIFYDKDGKKIVTMSVLDQLNDMAHSIWFTDKAVVNCGRVQFNVTQFYQNGSEVILQYFSELGFEPELIQKNKSLKIRMSLEGSEKYLRLVVPKLPKFIADYLL